MAKNSTASSEAQSSLLEKVSQNRSNESTIDRHIAAILLNPAPKRAKASKLLAFCQQLTLRRLFHLIGFSIGSYPVAYLIAGAIIASLSCGMHFLKLEDRVRDGYTPSTSPSRYETDVFREFLQSVGDPTLTTVVLRARDGGSMHRLKLLAEAERIHSFLMKNLSASVPSTGEHVVYGDLCGSYCDTNIAIQYFHRALVEEVAREKAGKPRSQLMNLTYPIAKIGGFDIHLERNFYGVRLIGDRQTGEHNSTLSDDPDLEIVTSVTQIEYVHLILMIFRGDIPTVEMEAKLNAWELAVYDFSRNENFSDSDVEMLVLGTEIVNQELIKDSQEMVAYFVSGFCAMLFFVAITVLISAGFNGLMDPAKVLVATGATLCPVVAVTTTFGVCAIAGMRTNTIMLIMPFLIMGIGVNDAFLMIHSWQRLSGRVANERLGLTLEEVGPSITITTLTNVITFGIGALTPTPEIALFCAGTAMALGFAYIFTLVLFGPVLYVASVAERTRKKSVARDKMRGCLRSVLRVYCSVITSRIFGWILLIGSLVYWYFAIMGTLNINTRLDVEKLLPRNSQLQESNSVVSSFVWPEYYPVTVLVNNPLDIKVRSVLDRFDSMVNDFESMEKCRGQRFTLLWLREYRSYWESAPLFDFDYYEDEDAATTTVPLKRSAESSGLDYSRLHGFLQSPLHQHWSTFMRLSNDSDLMVEKFFFTIVYHNSTSWNDRIELMQHWRKIAAQYADLNITVWEANSMFVDQMLSLKTLTLRTGIWTLICMAAVCALFIKNPFSVLTASMAIASISIGVVGYLSWWHLDLDPATMCAILMSIGMSVDFTAHVSYHYQLRKKKEIRDSRIVQVALRGSREKLEHTMESVAWPMTQAGLSTVTCVLPLVFLQNYIPLVFMKTISLVVIWGLFHGLVLLPAFLSSVPQVILEYNCYRAIFYQNRPGSSHLTARDSTVDDEHEVLSKVELALQPLQLQETALFTKQNEQRSLSTSAHDTAD